MFLKLLLLILDYMIPKYILEVLKLRNIKVLFKLLIHELSRYYSP